MMRPDIRFFLYQVYDLARHIRRWQEKISREEGFTLPQFRAMAQLCKHDGVNQTELATMIESDPMTVGGIIERLEARELVTRAPHPTDSRAKVVFATESARALVDEVRAKGAKYEPLILEGISADEMMLALSVIERVNANLSKYSHVFEESEHEPAR